METKKIIKKLNHGSEVFETETIFAIKITEIINLLEDGERCKQMLSEVENFIGSSDINIDEFKKIEQKYFPKEDIEK